MPPILTEGSKAMKNEDHRAKRLWLVLLSLLLLSACQGAPFPSTKQGGRALTTFTSEGDVFATIFSPDGRTFLLLDFYKEVAEVRTLPDGNLRWRVKREETRDISAGAFSPDGAEVALAEGGTLRFYDAGDGSLRGELLLGDDARWVSSLAYRADGTLAVAVIRGEEKTLWVEVWSRAGEQVKEPIRLETSFFSHQQPYPPFSSDGSRLAYIAEDEHENLMLVFVDLESGQRLTWPLTEPLRRRPEEYPNDLYPAWLALSPDGKETALGTFLRSPYTLPTRPVGVRIATESGQVLGYLQAPRGIGPELALPSLAYSPDGRRMAVGMVAGPDDKDFLALYDLEAEREPELLCRGQHRHGCARSPVFSPDGRFLVTGRREVTIWELP